MAPARRVGRLQLAVLVVSLALLAPTTAAGAPFASAVGTQVDPDGVVLEATLQEDGDATWEVRYRVRLDDDDAVEAFESLEDDVRANASAFERRFADRMNGTVAAAQDATGREMAVRNVTVSTARQDLGQRYGVLTYRFEWTNFATANGTTIVAGDAVGGLFLDEETTFTIRWPGGYTTTEVSPSPSETGDRSATWRGPREFTADQPRLVVTTGSTSNLGPTGPPLAILAGGLLVALLAGGGVVWLRRRGGAVPTEEGDPPEELLSNEERVLRLLEENGGRMKQQQVVEELGWTDAKTSQVVGDLRESGEIEGFRLGRENVLRLPEEE